MSNLMNDPGGKYREKERERERDGERGERERMRSGGEKGERRFERKDGDTLSFDRNNIGLGRLVCEFCSRPACVCAEVFVHCSLYIWVGVCVCVCV